MIFPFCTMNRISETYRSESLSATFIFCRVGGDSERFFGKSSTLRIIPFPPQIQIRLSVFPKSKIWILIFKLHLSIFWIWASFILLNLWSGKGNVRIIKSPPHDFFSSRNRWTSIGVRLRKKSEVWYCRYVTKFRLLSCISEGLRRNQRSAHAIEFHLTRSDWKSVWKIGLDKRRLKFSFKYNWTCIVMTDIQTSQLLTNPVFILVTSS